MRRGILAGVLLLGMCAAVGAATWSCGGYVESLLPSAYLVAAACKATGTYTTGGDPFAGGSGELCNSQQRKAGLALVSIAGRPGSGEAVAAVWDPQSSHIVLATSGTGNQSGFPQLADGTLITGFILQALTFCY